MDDVMGLRVVVVVCHGSSLRRAWVDRGKQPRLIGGLQLQFASSPFSPLFLFLFLFIGRRKTSKRVEIDDDDTRVKGKPIAIEMVLFRINNNSINII